jgi:hypothetical protein
MILALSIGREWVAFKLRTTPGEENTRKASIILFYFHVRTCGYSIGGKLGSTMFVPAAAFAGYSFHPR